MRTKLTRYVQLEPLIDRQLHWYSHFAVTLTTLPHSFSLFFAQAWADYEDEEWHEDTFEWKRKIASKHQVPFDIEALQREGAAGMARIKETMLASEATSGNTQMAFLTLKDGVAETDEERGKLGAQWAALLGTNAVKISYHFIGGNELLITEEQSRIVEVKDFLLNQPEVAKFRWKDTDFYPTPTPTPHPDGPWAPKTKKGKAAKAKKAAASAAKQEL